MKYINYLILLCIFSSISACGKSESTQDKLFETQRDALDKAKQVGQKVDQQMQDLRQNVEKQSGN